MLKSLYSYTLVGVLLSKSLFAAAPNFSLPISAPQAVLMDYRSGAVLFDKNAHEKMVPSSMTKIMTVYLIFEAIKNGTLTLDQTLYVSEKARAQIGSRMFVEAASNVRVEELIKGTIVSSGNDSSVVLAEGLAGDESVFAMQMTAKAHELGAVNTHFLESHGLPNPDHYTTAYDLALIAQSTIKEFPKLYEAYYPLVKYKYNNIEQYTHNTLLRQGKSKGDYTVDGFKTGFTDAGGYGIVFSAIKKGTRLIGVVNGLEKPEDRIQEARTLLQWGFHQNQTMQLMAKSESYFSLPVKDGKEEKVSVSAHSDAYITYPNQLGKEGLKFEVRPIKEMAPITKGDHVADLYVKGTLVDDYRVPLYADEDVAKRGLLSRFFQMFANLFGTPEKVSEEETMKLVRSSLLFRPEDVTL